MTEENNKNPTLARSLTRLNEEHARGVTIHSTCQLPSRWSAATRFVMLDVDGVLLGALLFGTPHGEVAVRIHSACFTSEVLGSERCDCRAQLEAALKWMGAADCGVIIYTFDEGRGIGLPEKVRAYALQDEGLDTVDANIALGHPVDSRDFSHAARALRALGVDAVAVHTNNPAKLEALRAAGLGVRRVSLHVPTPGRAAAYMETKRLRCGHQIDVPAEDSGGIEREEEPVLRSFGGDVR